MQYKGKPIIPTKAAMDELSDINLDLYEAAEILERGFELRKRKKHIIERAINKGIKIINIVVIDKGDHYKLIHAGRFSISKKFKELIKNES